MKRTTYDADLTSKILLKGEELGWDHPDLDFHLVKLILDIFGQDQVLDFHVVRLILDFFSADQRKYDILDDSDSSIEEASFPDLVNARVERWW